MVGNIKQELSSKQIKQLVLYSKTDPGVLEFTSDRKRFASVRKTKLWLGGDRVVFSLTDKEGNLLGIIWFSRKKWRDYPVTFAIRLYGKARGKGLAYHFMKKCFGDYVEKTGEKRFWLEVSCNNIAAIKTYEKFGFKAITGPDKRGKIIMTLDL